MVSQERSLPSLSIQRDMWGPKCYSFVRFDNIQCECLLAIIIVEPKLAQFEVTVIPKSLVHNFQQVRANVCNFLLIEQKVCILSCSIYSYSPSYFKLTGHFFDQILSLDSEKRLFRNKLSSRSYIFEFITASIEHFVHCQNENSLYKCTQMQPNKILEECWQLDV